MSKVKGFNKNHYMQKSKISKYWQKNPEEFNNSYTEKRFLARFVNLFLNKRINQAMSMLSNVQLKNKQVLDVGCGGGQYLEKLIKRKAYVTGVDYSEKMIELARRFLKDRGYKGYFLIKADVSNLPFEKNRFDLVVATGLLEYLIEPSVAMKEISRVMKPNAFCLIGFSKKWSPFFFLRFSFGLFLRKKLLKLPEIATVFNKNDVQRYFTNNHLKIIQIQEIMRTEYLVLGKKYRKK